MDSDRIICLNEDDCDESQNYNSEDEFLDKKDNYLGNLVLKTRSILFDQLNRVIIFLSFKN